jgi:Flp pilus assembly protein TadG
VVETKTRERGATLLLVIFVSAFLLIPIIGVCIDGAVQYWAKSRLQSAVDAATLATARALNVGQTVQQQEQNATAIGAQYFTANFPPGVMNMQVVGGQNISASIHIDETQLRQRIVTLTVSATVPLFFMPILGFRTGTVAATGQATRRDANIMLVLDRSNSMNPGTLNPVGACSQMSSDALNYFVNQFVEGRDRLGLVTFQTAAYVDFAPSQTFKSGLTTALNSLVCNGDTNTPDGLYSGFNQITTVINQPGALNVILLFTDGEPNALAANFLVRTSSDTRYDPNNTSTLDNNMPASSCQVASPLTGVIADGTGETATNVTALNATGATYGVLSATGIPASNNSNGLTTIGNSRGCAFSNSGIQYARQDIQAIPATDAHGQSTANRGMVPNLDVFTSGPYTTLIRPDMPRTVRWAAFNAADSMAQTIRNNSTYGTVIYTIGLQGNEPMLIDQDFMERMANDPRASNYDSTKASGQFILATDNTEMAQAFQQVASQILRLSR